LRISSHFPTGYTQTGGPPELLQQRRCAPGVFWDLGSRFMSSLDGRLAAPFHARRVPQEMDVVRVVGQRVDSLGTALSDVILIGGDGVFVTHGCISVTAEAPENGAKACARGARPPGARSTAFRPPLRLTTVARIRPCECRGEWLQGGSDCAPAQFPSTSWISRVSG